MVDVVRKAIDMFTLHAESSDETLSTAFVHAGHSRAMAQALTIFVPVAFARVIFTRMGVQCPPTYKRPVTRGQFSLRRFEAQPIFVAATELASSGAISQAVFISVAGRSAEFKAVNKALHAGSRPENLLMAESIIEWPIDETQLEPQTTPPVESDKDAPPTAKNAPTRKGWLARFWGG